MAPVAATLSRKLAHTLAQEKPVQREQARAQEVSPEAVPAASEPSVPAHTLDARVAVLETRWEETIPTLATKADLADIRAELAEVKTSLIRWVIGVGASALVAFIGLLFASHHSTNTRFDQVNARFDQVNARIDQLQSETNARFDQVNLRIDQLQSETNARFDQVNQRIDQVNQRLDQMNQRFDQMNSRMDRLFELVAAQQVANKPQ